MKKRGIRSNQKHPWTGRDRKARRSSGPSQLGKKIRTILARTAAGMAEMEERRGADLSEYKHLKVMVIVGPPRPRRSFRKSKNEYEDDNA